MSVSSAKEICVMENAHAINVTLHLALESVKCVSNVKTKVVMDDANAINVANPNVMGNVRFVINVSKLNVIIYV